MHNALNWTIAEHGDEIRDATHVLLALGKHRIWSLDHRVRQLETAAFQLQRTLDTQIYCSAVHVAEVPTEIRAFQNRAKRRTIH